MDESSTLASTVEFPCLQLAENERGCMHMAARLELFAMPVVVLVYNDKRTPTEFHVAWRHPRTPHGSRLWCVSCYMNVHEYQRIEEARIGPICFSLLTHASHLTQIPFTFSNLIRAMPPPTSDSEEFYNSPSDIGRISLLSHIAALHTVNSFVVEDPKAYLSSVQTIRACWYTLLPPRWKPLIRNFLHIILKTIRDDKKWTHLGESMALLRELVKSSRY